MRADAGRVLVVQVAVLGADLVARETQGAMRIAGIEFHPFRPVFPAVTCTAQATFRTAAEPREHGMVANGYFSRELARPFFWEQSSRLVSGDRIWRSFRASGRKVAVLFWQQSLGRDVDVLLSPAPIHKHHGGMIQDCFSVPRGLYGDLAGRFGRFALSSYWGPMASLKSTRWIALATAEVCRRGLADLVFTYLPHLDYELQKTGPESKGSRRAFGELASILDEMVTEAGKAGYRVLVWGDYAMQPVGRAVFPNRAFLEDGLLPARRIKGMLYPDIFTGRAFAMVDHQVAHVYVREEDDIRPVRERLEALDGVGRVLGPEEKRSAGIDHPRSGDLVLEAEPGSWFAYPWWSGRREAPEYASHIDIHSKPGYDPCELFRGSWPFTVSTDPGLVRGSHGLVDADHPAAWGSDFLEGRPATLVDLASALRGHLDEGVTG